MRDHKKLLTRGLLCGILVSGLGFSLQQTPIPDYPGDDNPRHNGQPMFCQNFDTKEHKHNCECQAMSGDDERCKSTPEDDEENGVIDGPYSSKCKTTCRRSACFCQTHCTT